ncbi:FUN14 domain-containing protein fndc-1 [Caenorhabditis elegans]|uniref:FUN14 domain-containing protein fndc-1 n=1 Tax=Caenorhabditis elegans TaxID=6239 RepID=FNDC1_CAEEL|nr:FUN14 domain-containing protein fndc-1 [Caenorhabditis elegans]Q22252.1 RecName: Full=FUN14 domain-containing protein fndc-1 [Caenorhabditis elegans]CAA88970.1 FUN14 domain-containing protein fndc-1 [Caenorhabditis elegans]|eukprot:NP_496404.1 FuN14 (FUN14) Domain Containing homolog [Caenorhabditis elegans]
MVDLSKNDGGSGKAGKGVSDAIDTVLYYVVDLKKQQPMVQLGVGAGFGTVTGYFVTKGGRLVAATVGISFLLAQFAIHKGYITLNESKIERDMKNLHKSVMNKVSGKKVINISDSFVSEYRWILGGFAAGMLIGFSVA